MYKSDWEFGILHCTIIKYKLCGLMKKEKGWRRKYTRKEKLTGNTKFMW